MNGQEPPTHLPINHYSSTQIFIANYKNNQQFAVLENNLIIKYICLIQVAMHILT